MNKVLRTAVLDPLVEFHRFSVEDSELADYGNRTRPALGPDDYLLADGGTVYIRTPGHTHNPLITFQAWPSEPPPETEGAWELTQDTTIVCRSGSVGVRSEIWTGVDFPLGSPGVYQVRVYSRGRDAIRLADENPELDPDTEYENDEDDPYVHAEQYLFQFWQVGPLTS